MDISCRYGYQRWPWKSVAAINQLEPWNSAIALDINCSYEKKASINTSNQPIYNATVTIIPPSRDATAVLGIRDEGPF